MTEMVTTQINGRWSLKLPDYRAEREEWATGWEVERLDSMRRLMHRYEMEPRPVVYDVGTEEGDLSALYSKWGADLVLIEPNGKVWPNVRAIWHANNLRSPLACFHGFASERDKDVLTGLHRTTWPGCAAGPLMRAHGFLSLADDYKGQPMVTIDTLAAILDMAEPDAITIDVEGAELRVLWGAAGTLAHHKPVVWVSIHPEEMKQYGHRPVQLRAFMYERGYDAEHLGTDHEEHWLFTPER